MVSTDSNGSNVPATPSRKEHRRRSWFGLVTPKRKERVSVMPTTAEPPSTLDGNMDGMEELEATPIRPSPGDAFVSRQWPVTDEDEQEDDSDREGTVRRKSSKSRPKQSLFTDDRGGDESPVRMKDMTTLAILSRNNTVKPVRALIGPHSNADASTETFLISRLLSDCQRQLVVGRRASRSASAHLGLDTIESASALVVGQRKDAPCPLVRCTVALRQFACEQTTPSTPTP